MMASPNLLTTLRPIQKVVQGQKMMEGAGVQICRTVRSRFGFLFLLIRAVRPRTHRPLRREIIQCPAKL
jgi:hypothetical protein